MSNPLRALLRAVPFVGPAIEARRALKRINPGHFYSAVPSLDEVARDAQRIYDRSRRDLPGVDLNEPGQLAMIDALARFYDGLPFGEQPREGLRYHFENPYFLYNDAIFLYGMIRWAKPKRIVEVGSGYSTFVMLDTSERFFDGAIRITCVEPFDDRLRAGLKPGDTDRLRIRTERAQDVPVAVFESLEAGDILFIDSSHVSKVGSDVNRLWHEVVPRVAPGVLVHVHDMFYPFEYPREWVEKGRCWNEAYLVRAFLGHNAAFEVLAWNEYLARFHREALERAMPLCLRNTGGSLWLRRRS